MVIAIPVLLNAFLFVTVIRPNDESSKAGGAKKKYRGPSQKKIAPIRIQCDGQNR